VVEEMLAFWQARLAEDEAAARAASDETTDAWFTDTSEEPDERSIRYTGPSATHPGSEWDHVIADRVPQDVAKHVARHDPGRVLRRAQAQRAVIEECVRALGYPRNAPFANLARRVVAASVAEWAGHPEFRAEWGA
jgi:uncharacterized protein DUF6221